MHWTETDNSTTTKISAASTAIGVGHRKESKLITISIIWLLYKSQKYDIDKFAHNS